MVGVRNIWEKPPWTVLSAGAAQRVLNVYYRRPGFLAVVRFGSVPTPFPLSRQQARPGTHMKTLKERNNLRTGEWEREVGKESNHTTAKKPGPP
jgi:hypothetical protein